MAAALLTVLLGCGLTACGSGTGTEDAKAAGGGPFPVTVQGKLGEAQIAHRPRRVVALDWTSADIAVTLGVRPVAIASVAGAPNGIEPWTAARLGGSAPERFSTTNGDPIEKIASYRPDLILAAKDYNLTDSYPKLSRLAPVVHYTGGPNADSWERSTQVIGRALGTEDRANRLIAETKEAIGKARGELSSLRDKSFSFLVAPQANGVHVVNSGRDVSARLLGQLGLRLSAPVQRLPDSSTVGRAKLSYETLGTADADVVFATGQPDSLQALKDNPAFGTLAAVRAGHYIPLEPQLAQAVAFPSPGSLQWSLRQLVPKLRALH